MYDENIKDSDMLEVFRASNRDILPKSYFGVG